MGGSMMYKDLNENEIPRAGYVLGKHVKLDKTGRVDCDEQSVINAMHDYANIKCKPLNDLIFSLEQQLEERNISIAAAERLIPLDDDYYNDSPEK